MLVSPQIPRLMSTSLCGDIAVSRADEPNNASDLTPNRHESTAAKVDSTWFLFIAYVRGCEVYGSGATDKRDLEIRTILMMDA